MIISAGKVHFKYNILQSCVICVKKKVFTLRKVMHTLLLHCLFLLINKQTNIFNNARCFFYTKSEMK